ncbi:MAG: winged helix-turn-helix transcriptional regulator [Rhodospirillales bacterium]|nr:winged helix-turn-helix transcriptional regulator [Rhodospirillales bacterium]
MVDDNAATSQRSMASDLGIALGLANAYLKRCVKKGLIKVSQAPANRYAYYLTPKGFSEKSRLTAEYLKQSFNLFRHVRTEGAELLGQCQARGWNRVALYGLSDLSEIMTLSVRDYDVELVCVIDRDAEVAEFAGLPVFTDMPAPQDVDAKIICDIAKPQAAYDDACAGFPPDRVLAPGILHISKNGGNGGRKPGAGS